VTDERKINRLLLASVQWSGSAFLPVVMQDIRGHITNA